MRTQKSLLKSKSKSPPQFLISDISIYNNNQKSTRLSTLDRSLVLNKKEFTTKITKRKQLNVVIYRSPSPSKPLYPFTQNKVIQSFMNNRFHTKIVKCQNQSSFENIVREDPYIGQIFDHAVANNLMFQHLAELPNRIPQYPKDYLRKIHKKFAINKFQFNRLKQLYIQNALKEKDNFGKLSQFFEQTRQEITQEESLESQLGNLDNLVFKMYNRIFDDSLLAPSFQNVSIKDQSIKFARLLKKIIDYNQSNDDQINNLRSQHQKYHLTNNHYLHFKYHFYHSLKEIKISNDIIYNLLEIMNNYKFAIIGQHSIKELIEIKVGLDKFYALYNDRCLQREDLQTFIHLRGVDNFKKHTQSMFSFFLNKNKLSITVDDLKYYHQKSKIISETTFNSFKEVAQELVQDVNPHYIVYYNFFEDWENSRQYVLNQVPLYEALGGWDICDKIIVHFQQEIFEQNQVKKIYSKNCTDIHQTTCREIQYLFSNRSYLKAEDIQLLHDRLKITNQNFNFFCLSLQRAMIKENLGHECFQPVSLKLEKIRNLIVKK